MSVPEAVVGVGAAAYAPAKYGLVTELVAPAGLVAANGWIEVTTVCAAVFGAVIGGLVVGLAENLSVLVIPASFKAAVPFVILILVLYFRPEGLLGTAGRK